MALLESKQFAEGTQAADKAISHGMKASTRRTIKP